jgi:DNA-binding MarR family transcriptional regulator
MAKNKLVTSNSFEAETERMRVEGGDCALKHFTMTTRRIVSRWDAALKPSGLTGSQFHILATLAARGDCNIKTLAARLDMEASSLSRTLNPLLVAGYLKASCGEDARQKIIGLTHKGRHKFCQAAPLWKEIQDVFLDKIGRVNWGKLIGSMKKVRLATEDIVG